MKASIVVLLFCVFTGSMARSSNCPTPQWFVAEFVAIMDEVISPSAPISILDSSLSYFRDVMRFTEEEIAQVEEDAMQFYNTRFGLDFSQSEPDEWGQRFYQNATLLPARVPPEIYYVVTFNRWIVSGNTKSMCFDFRVGSYRVNFNHQQILHGTYGGEEGIPAVPGDCLAYGFYNIPVCPQEPLVFQFSSISPFRVDPYDGFVLINVDVVHRVWGHGLAQGVTRLTPTEDGRVRVLTRNLITFPAHPTFVP